MSEEKTEKEVKFSVVMEVDPQFNVELTPVEGKEPETMDDIYLAVCLMKRNIEAQNAAHVNQAIMMQTAKQMQMEMEGKTKSGIVIPENKNIR